jgi:glutamate 5-kinase
VIFPPASTPRLVVKVGSALLVEPDGRARTAWMRELAAGIAARTTAGQRVVLVSSGAIALGARRLGLAKGGRASLEDAQAAAAVGQVVLSAAWADALAAHGLAAAQVLLTLGDLEDRRRYLNASATFERLMALGAVPVVNENDSVATEEILFGDNDRLAARVAAAAAADAVLLLSDVDGLYDRDPLLPGAIHLPRVDRIDNAIEAMASGGSASGMGSGGMASKVAAARLANAAGVRLAVASGREGRPLMDEARHTLFAGAAPASRRRAWLVGGLTASGVVRVDQGAVEALRGGASLLAAGAVSLEGRFARGDLLVIEGPGGPVARGLSEYDAPDAVRLLGKRREEHAALLGYAPRSALVHRDHLALL